MKEFWESLFLGSGFMPHGHCYLWTPGIVWLHVISDALITLAYYSIPLTLAWFVRRRRDIDFRWMFMCFAVFILACGTTHLMEIWNVWHGNYWLSGAVKALTAAASVPTAILLTRLMPQALALPSPSALTQANSTLETEIQMRRRAQESLHDLNLSLEKRVAERTAELHAANGKLRESQQFLRAIIDNSTAVVYVKDLSGRYLLVNTRFEQIFQLPSRAILGRTDHDFFSKEQADAFRVVDEQVVAAGTAQEMEERATHHDGLHTYISIKCPLFDADGKPYAMCGISTDITERKRTEDAVRESEARKTVIMESALDCIITADHDGRILEFNPAAQRTFGYSQAEVLGKELAQTIIPPAAREHHRRGIAHYHATGEGPVLGKRIEVMGMRADGSEFPVELAINAIRFNGRSMFTAYLRDITERRRAEAALRQSEARFAKAFQSNPAAMSITTIKDGRFIEINERYSQLFDYTREELVGRTVVEMGLWADPAERALLVERLEARAPVREHRSRFQRKNGDHIYALISMELIEFPGEGEPVLISMFADLTAREQAEARLRGSEERLRLIMNLAPHGIFAKDGAGRYIFVNHTLAEVCGVSVEEVLGKTDFDLVPDRVQAEAYRADDLAVIQSGLQKFIPEEPITDSTGRLRFLQTTKIPFTVPETGERAVLGVWVDITARKRAEEALRASEEHFRFLNDLSEATRTLADSEQIMAVMARMLGGHLAASRCAYADVEHDGEQFTILHDYTDGCASTVGQYRLSLFGARAVATLHSGETLIIRDVEAELSPADGADMFNAIGIQAIITCPLVKDGRLCAMMAVHQTIPRDWTPDEITIVQDVVERCWATIERRAAEEKIQQLNAELEQRVIERTEQLEAANKELEAFSYSVSHDLRSPLRAIDGFSQAVIEDYGPQLPEEGRGYLQTIRGEAQRMSRLIDDLLTFSRLGRAPLNKRTIQTPDLVRGALDELQPQQEGRKIDLRIGDLPECMGDSSLLKQVWINLLSNAFKYTLKRDAAEVEIGSLVQDGETVYFVRDNGAGFDMRYAGKLFGVFQRLHRADEYEGTGVGLALVQRIVHRHGGRVWAEAALDRGATFYFTLPGPPPS